MKKGVVLATLILAAMVILTVRVYYPEAILEKAFITISSLAVIYLVFRIILEGRVTRRLGDPKAAYAFRKIVSIVYVAIFMTVFAVVWIPEPQTLLVALGIVGAGIAIALQDIFKNFVASAVIFFSGVYGVGDRIEMNGRSGDVVDIGLQYTTLMEIREWIDGDQVTGRLSSIPNGHVLSGVVNNYTRDYKFIWDEIGIPVTYESDWRKAAEKVLAIAERETVSEAKLAEEEMESLSKKYSFEKRMAAPTVFVKFTDNWIYLCLRYVSDARTRRATHSRISGMILEDFEKTDDIRIASQTAAIVGFPELFVRGPSVTRDDQSHRNGLRRTP